MARAPKIKSVRASVLTPLLKHIADQGSNIQEFIAKYGITRTQLSDPYSVLPLGRYVTLFEAAAVHLKDPDLGLKLAMRVQPADMGPMGVLFSLSPSIAAGFQRLASHVMALQSGTQSNMFEVNGDLVWTYRLQDPVMWPRRQDAEYTLAACAQLVRSCFSPEWKPLEVHFEHAESANPQLLQRIFRAPVLYRQASNRIIMGRDDATRIYRSEDRELVTILEHHLADLIGDESDESQTMTDRIRNRISLYLGQKPVTLTALAAELNMSARSLQRRLAEEGTSLRDLVREHRIQLAANQLTQKDARVTQIAHSLGYADGTVFWRAYRGWKGEPPSAAKGQRRAAQDASGDDGEEWITGGA
ncbi:MAG: AraC family transcriptional regulator [Pannonibacter phragmitetus]|uniref:Urease operon transcriptional activator n=1 Tax=Pannonibacter phragmitetus TaxID=121719 RepID=A0A378ZVS0_9HYPH|nr:AraC family transcriptional regulator [Pannonibacter phragmitetus]SUB01334.1 Urease operon transcriptional activator [Pannonibacter phragmitetus]